MLPPNLLIVGEILRHAGRTVQHERITRLASIAFLIAGAFEIEMLFALEQARRGCCRWRWQRARPVSLTNFNRFFRVGAKWPLVECAPPSSPSSNCAPTRWPGVRIPPNVVMLGVFDDLAGDLGVLFKRLVRGVNHHAEPFINAFFAEFEGVAVIGR